MRRVASCETTMSPIATIHVTSIEFVMGNPNGRAISTAPWDRPCGSAAASGTDAVSAHITIVAMDLRRFAGFTAGS